MKNNKSQCLWNDLVTGKFYIIQNDDGKQTQVESSSEPLKQFSNETSGKSNYQERVFRAQNNLALMPQKVNSLKLLKNTKLYTPQIKKLNGYAQSPSSQLEASHLTSSLSDIPSTCRKYKKPDTIFLEKKLFQFKINQDQTKQQEKTFLQQFDNNKPTNQEAKEFQNKLEKAENKHMYMSLLEQDSLESFRTYLENKSKISQDSFVSNTHTMCQPKKQQITTSQYLINEYKREVKELEGFKISNENNVAKIQTKNRFNVKIRTNSEQHILFDRYMDKQGFLLLLSKFLFI